jgi:transcriptional regulator GlxA family with amidase domain
MSATCCRIARRSRRAADGRRSVRELAAEVGVGERRLQQLFHALCGMTPSEFLGRRSSGSSKTPGSSGG